MRSSSVYICIAFRWSLRYTVDAILIYMEVFLDRLQKKNMTQEVEKLNGSMMLKRLNSGVEDGKIWSS